MSIEQPQIRITAELPYLLLLPSGNYETDDAGNQPGISESLKKQTTGELERRTHVSMNFVLPSTTVALDDSAIEKMRIRRTRELLRAVNRLLRWYRTAFSHPQIVELTSAQVSPVTFIDTTTNKNWGGLEPLVFVRGATKAVPDVVAAVETVRRGLAGGTDPNVTDLNILDARYAHQAGRFREAVLLCWGAIDSTFSAKYTSLTAAKLAGEWAGAREHLTNFELPLKVRMTGMMHLVAGRSLFREPALWDELVRSYEKRNGIIHRGESANEDDAALALHVADKVVSIMTAL